MARGRMVNTSIATDKALNSLSIEAELLYLKAVPHLDRDGLIIGDPDLLLAKIAPRRMAAFIGRMGEVISEWINAGLVLRYESKDGPVLYFTGFRKNNTIRYDQEAPSIFPVPPGYERTITGLTLKEERGNNVPATGEEPGNNGEESLPQPLLKEKKGKEIQPGCDADFARVCTAYEQNIGFLSPLINEKLQADMEDYGSEWLIEALGIATSAEKRSLSYAEGVLKKWRQNGKGQRNGNGKTQDDDPYKGKFQI